MWFGIMGIALAVAAGGYTVVQYRAAQWPALTAIPEYPYGKYGQYGSAYPFSQLSVDEQDSVRNMFRKFVSDVQPDYHVVAERFMAGKSPGFEIDALRGAVDNYLYRGQRHRTVGEFNNRSKSPIYYLAGGRYSRVQRFFNDGAIALVALEDPIRSTPPNEKLRVYAYFELAPNRTGKA